ncbi:hypothetical protein [Streptomyces sp. NPDC001530]|uniref:hypothetical protein n=1 Tax=Streptomyces sp. NPDC001530 TaxID=3364582 RepID=UPI00368E1DF4
MRLAQHRGLPADMVRWGCARDAIYRRIMRRGWSAQRNAYVQYEDSVTGFYL